MSALALAKQRSALACCFGRQRESHARFCCGDASATRDTGRNEAENAQELAARARAAKRVKA
jgi:hypothetical protein